jgi:hypothetical protein
MKSIIPTRGKFSAVTELFLRSEETKYNRDSVKQLYLVTLSRFPWYILLTAFARPEIIGSMN